MADKTHIEWTDATWNPITGCSVVSPGCTNCYAMKLAGTRLKDHPSRAGLTDDSKAGPVWNGTVRLNEAFMEQPLKWRKPRNIFVCAHGDLFHENVPDAWIARIFRIMESCPKHTFQILTKRPQRMKDFLTRCQNWEGWMTHNGNPVEAYGGNGLIVTEAVRWPLPNVWLGVSVEDQKRADERIPPLLETPAAVRFISAEPLLGEVDLYRGGWSFLKPSDKSRYKNEIDWVIVGGESGKDARPMHPDWARGLRDQCQKAGVPFFFKQWGMWAPYDRGSIDSKTLVSPGCTDTPFIKVGKKTAGRLLDGREWNDMPKKEQIP